MASASCPLKRRRNNWKNLPDDLLDLILHKLVLLPDCIRFSVVCKDWFSIAVKHKQKQNRVNPMLFIPNTDKNYHNLLNIWDNKVYDFQFPIPYRKNCSSSSHSWWAVAEMDMSITLTNPFSSKTIRLPSIINVSESSYRFKSQYNIFKVVLSCDPLLNPDNYMVAVIYSFDFKLAFFKSGEQSWTYIDKSLTRSKDCQFYKGQLYVTNHETQLITIDCNSYSPTRISIEYVVKNTIYISWRSYIVESWDGCLLIIVREYSNNGCRLTMGFNVYKLKITNSNKREWEKIDDLGNCALFLGNNQSICIPASSLPATCQPNSIYYTDDTCRQWLCSDPDFVTEDTGVFHLETKEIRRFDQISEFLCNGVAVWIFPTWS